MSSMKVVAIEVKSSSTRFHDSIDEIARKYSKYVGRKILFSQKDVAQDQNLELMPLYMAPFLFEEL